MSIKLNHKTRAAALTSAAALLISMTGPLLAQTRQLVIPGHQRALAGVGRGLEPGILHVSPNPYEKDDNVEYYQRLVTQSRANPAPQRISGTCAQACTMQLGIRGACVEPDAELWFLPALSKTGIIQPARTRAMFATFPGAIARWAFAATGANSPYDVRTDDVGVFSANYPNSPYGRDRGPYYAVLTGAQAISLGANGCR